jgi:CheY-like chemotaxis protein
MNKLLSGRRILVVEDEMLILMMIEGILDNLGCKSVATAATVDQAVTLLEGQVFDAAMLDVDLNGTKSYPVADVLAARGVCRSSSLPATPAPWRMVTQTERC